MFGKGCHKRKSSAGNMRQSQKIKEGQIGQQSVTQIYIFMHICFAVGTDYTNNHANNQYICGHVVKHMNKQMYIEGPYHLIHYENKCLLLRTTAHLGV